MLNRNPRLFLRILVVIVIVTVFLVPSSSRAQCLGQWTSQGEELQFYSDIIGEMISSAASDEKCLDHIQDRLVVMYSGDMSDSLQMIGHQLRIEVGVLVDDYYSVALDLTRHMEIQLEETGEYHRPILRNDVDPEFFLPAEALARGMCYEHLGYYSMAFEQIRTSLESPMVRECKLAYTLALKRALSLSRFLGKYDLATGFAEERLDYVVNWDMSDYFLVGECLNDLGMVFLESGDYDMVDVYLDSSLTVRKLLPEPVSFGPVGNAHDSKGTYYLTLQDYSSALNEFQLALEKFKRINKIGYSPDIPVCYSNMGQCYWHLGEYELASEAYQQSVSWFKKIQGKHFHYTSHIHLRLSELYLRLEQPESARSWLTKARADLDSLGYTSATEDIQVRLVDFEISELMEEEGWTWESGFLALDSMISLAFDHPDVATSLLIDLYRRKLIFYEEHSIQSLAPVLEKSLELDARIRRDSYGLSTAGKVHSSSQYRQYIADLIAYLEPHQSNMDDQHWNALLVLIESSKSELRRKYAFEHAIRVGKSEEAEAFGQIVSEIAAYERKLNTLGSRENGELKSRLRLLELYDERNVLISKTGWKAQQQQILLGRNSLHFFESDESIFRISTMKRDRNISDIGTREDLYEQVRIFHEALSSNDPAKYLIPAFSLSNLLIGDIRISELDIYPDGVIQTIPFDALLRSAKGGEAFWEMDYWIKHACFSYPLEGETKQANQVSAFLVDSESLPGSVGEVERIESMFSGQELSNASDLRAYFGENDQIGILHLSVHGHHDPHNPMAGYLLLPGINGGRDTLEGHELISFPVNGKLAAIAACESGMSSLMENSESLSLSSFFHAAGFENTITSLWLANDHSTTIIFSDFYKRLGKGQEMTQALHEAKKSFSEKNKAQHASPLFWAHLRLSGSGGEMEANTTEVAWYWFLLLMIPGYLIFRRRSAA